MVAVDNSANDDRLTNAPPALAARAPGVRSRYQPLVLLLLALAAGIALDRYGSPQLVGWGFDSVIGSFGIVAWSSLSAACLVIWWLAWRNRRDALAAGLLLAAAAILGAAWHH